MLVPFLRSLGESKVDALLLSHYDLDHAGGAGALARNMKIELLILPSADSSSEMESTLLRKVKSSFVECASVSRKYEFGGTILEILDANEISTFASIKNGKYSLLFTGDIDSARERALKNLEQHDVLKVAHHGSKHSSSLKFLEQVQPKVAVISVGAGNSYGHPHPETLERLNNVGGKVLRTDELGAIKIVLYENRIECFGYVEGKFQRIAF